MDKFTALKPAISFDHDCTLVVAMELSGKSWLISAAVPGVDRSCTMASVNSAPPDNAPAGGP